MGSSHVHSGRLCEYCQTREATHFCEACKHWVCDSFVCRAKGAAVALGILRQTPGLQ
jgi:hypothetical protein